MPFTIYIVFKNEGGNLKLNNTRVRVGRIIYFILAVIFTLCIIAQVLFAGMAIFLYTVDWSQHMMFAHLFGFNLPILMLIFVFIGSMPRWAYWQLFGVFVAIFLMYFTANITANIPWLGSVHPIIAMLLFVQSYLIVSKTWSLISKNQQSERKGLK